MYRYFEWWLLTRHSSISRRGRVDKVWLVNESLPANQTFHLLYFISPHTPPFNAAGSLPSSQCAGAVQGISTGGTCTSVRSNTRSRECLSSGYGHTDADP